MYLYLKQEICWYIRGEILVCINKSTTQMLGLSVYLHQRDKKYTPAHHQTGGLNTIVG